MFISWEETDVVGLGGWRHKEDREERIMFVSQRASYIWYLTLRMTNLPETEGFQGCRIFKANRWS